MLLFTFLSFYNYSLRLVKIIKEINVAMGPFYKFFISNKLPYSFYSGRLCFISSKLFLLTFNYNFLNTLSIMTNMLSSLYKDKTNPGFLF